MDSGFLEILCTPILECCK